MAGDLKSKYGSSGVNITITLASLADGAKATSSEISNTSDLFLDVLVMIQVKTNASGVDAAGVVYVYAIGSVDGGTTYPDSDNDNKQFIGVMTANANATTYKSNALSVANAFNGKLPEKWKIVVENQTGAALDSTEGNHAKESQGVLGQFT